MFIALLSRESGEAIWAYQISPHDEHDYDAVNEYVLLELNIKGQQRKVFAHRAEMQHLRDRSRDLSADGRLELFKTTKKYDGDLGRREHGFPLAAELPA